MFHSIMVTIGMERMHSIHYSQIELNMMKVLFSFYSSIESTELAKQIIPHVDTFPIDFVNNNPLVIENENELDKLNDKSWSSIIVKPELFKELNNGLIFNDYPHVYQLIIQNCSLTSITSLTISNLPDLVFLTCQYESLRNVTKLKLESILFNDILMNRSS